LIAALYVLGLRLECSDHEAAGYAFGYNPPYELAG